MKYKLTCLECGQSDVLTIEGDRVPYWDKVLKTPFLSARWRKDSNWGFLCSCGNDNRLSAIEAKDMDKLVAGDPLSLKRITDSLKIPDNQQFKMEAI